MIRETEPFKRPSSFWRPLGCTGSRERVMRIRARTSFSLRCILLIESEFSINNHLSIKN